jgi:Cu-Zn family superoxide dismutase
MDADGSAVIVHAGPDNYGNIPVRYTSAGAASPGPDGATVATGDAGARIACGVVEAH